MATKEKNPKQVTVYGRLSYPTFTMAQATARNSSSEYPKKPEDIAPDFNLLLEPTQFKKIRDHVVDVFLPYCVAQEQAGEKRDALSQADADRIIKLIESEDWDAQPPYIAFKPVSDKTTELAPETVVSLKVVGNKGQDIDLRAIVTAEEELVVPDPDLLVYPTVKPIGSTVHQLYGGCYAVATLNLYAFISGKLPGFSASAGVCIFKADGERFGGGVAVDEDEIFAD